MVKRHPIMMFPVFELQVEPSESRQREPLESTVRLCSRCSISNGSL
jgi:hypothetical protein